MAGSTVGHERARSTRTAFDHDSGRREDEGDYDAEYESLTRSSLEALLGEVDRTLHAGPVAAEGGAGAAAHLAEAMQWSRRRAYFCVAGHSPLEDASRIGSAGGREGEPGGPGLTSLANSGEESGGSSDWCTGRAAPRRRPTSPASYLAPRLTEDGGGVMVRGVACRLHYNADEATEEPEVAGAMGDSAPPRCAGEGAEYVEELLASHGTLIETIAAHGGSGEVGGGGGGGGGEGDGSGGFRSPTEFGTAEGSSGRRGRGADLGGRSASNELRLCHRLGLPPRTPALAMREDSASAILRNWWLSLMPLLEVVLPRMVARQLLSRHSAREPPPVHHQPPRCVGTRGYGAAARTPLDALGSARARPAPQQASRIQPLPPIRASARVAPDGYHRSALVVSGSRPSPCISAGGAARGWSAWPRRAAPARVGREAAPVQPICAERPGRQVRPSAGLLVEPGCVPRQLTAAAKRQLASRRQIVERRVPGSGRHLR